jgi:hypothetical protein
MILACGKESNIPAYENISQSAGKSVVPAVAVSSDGTIYVVWADSLADNNIEILFSENYGGGWSTGLNISNNFTYSVAPFIDVDELGNVHVCWWDFVYDGPDSRILYRMRGSDGVWCSIEEIAHTTTTVDSVCELPRIVSDNMNNVYVMWGRYVGAGSGLRYSIKSNGNWSAVMAVPGSGAVNPAALATDGFGNLHIAYEGSNAIHYEMRTLSGAWQDFHTIAQGPSVPLQPDIAVDGSGVAYVTWSEQDDHYYIYYSDNEAGYWADPIQLPMNRPEDIGFYSAIDSEDDGTLHFVWKGRTKDTLTNVYGSGEVSYVRKYADNEWSDVHNISNTAARSIVDVGSIDVDDVGNAHIVWADEELGNLEVFYLMVPRDSF